MAANEYRIQRQRWCTDSTDERSIHTTDETTRLYVFVRSCEKLCVFFLTEGHPKRMPLPYEIYKKVFELLALCDKFILTNFPDAYIDSAEMRGSLLQPRKAWHTKK